MEKFIPFVIDGTLLKKKFEPNKIKESLIKETGLNGIDASKITEKVVRCIISISSNISHITAPMIREITNSILLQNGFEKERLKNTRIGIPFFDLSCRLNQVPIQVLTTWISSHIIKEYKNVADLIDTIKSEQLNTERLGIMSRKLKNDKKMIEKLKRSEEK